MKKIFISLIVIGVLISSCGKEPQITGRVGDPVHLAPPIEAPEDTAGCTFKWGFVEKPVNSNMDVLSFQPTSKAFNVFFVPDMPGEYKVSANIIAPNGEVKREEIFNCVIEEDTTQGAAMEQPKQTISETEVDTEDVPPPVYDQPQEVSRKPKTIRPPKTVQPERRPQRPEVAQNIPKVKGKYTIQISSWKTYQGAQRALSQLGQYDLDAYIQKAYFEETGETWYRIRTGTFDSYRQAKLAMQDLKSKLQKHDLWVDYIRKD